MTSDKTAREKREVTYEGTLTIRLSTDVSTETFQSREDDNIQNTERKKITTKNSMHVKTLSISEGKYSPKKKKSWGNSSLLILPIKKAIELNGNKKEANWVIKKNIRRQYKSYW